MTTTKSTKSVKSANVALSENLMKLVAEANKSGIKYSSVEYMAWLSFENYAPLSGHEVSLDKDILVEEITVTPKDKAIKPFKKVEVRVPLKKGGYVAFRGVKNGSLLAGLEYSADEIFAIMVKINGVAEWQFDSAVPASIANLEEGVMKGDD